LIQNDSLIRHNNCENGGIAKQGVFSGQVDGHPQGEPAT
jgi:hypothetical protein